MPDGQAITQEALQYMQHQTFSKFILDSKDLLENIKHFLKGEELVYIEKEYNGELIPVPIWQDDPNSEKPINKKGYSYIIKTLSPLMDKSTATGNISDEESNLLVRYTVDTLTEGLVINHEDFGLKTENEIDAIIEPILTLLKIHFSKSINMELIKEIFRTTHITENRQVGKQKEKEPSLTV